MPATVRGGKAATKARAETAGEAMPEAVAKAMMEMMEPLHDDDRRREAKEPG